MMSFRMKAQDQEHKHLFFPEIEEPYFEIFQRNPKIRVYRIENSILNLKIISTNSMWNQTYNPYSS